MEREGLYLLWQLTPLLYTYAWKNCTHLTFPRLPSLLRASPGGSWRPETSVWKWHIELKAPEELKLKPLPSAALEAAGPSRASACPEPAGTRGRASNRALGEALLRFRGLRGGRRGRGGMLGTTAGGASDVSSPVLPQGSQGQERGGPSASSRTPPRARPCPAPCRQPSRGSAVLAEVLGRERGVK